MGQVSRQAILAELWQLYQELKMPASELIASLGVYLTDGQLREVIQDFKVRKAHSFHGDDYGSEHASNS